MAELAFKNDHHHNYVEKTYYRHSTLDSLMRYAMFLGYGDVHTKIDEQTGLKAFIAVHNLKRGPAIGGCRMLNYPSTNSALEDALRLGYMMSYKAAINDLPHGGAKAVIIKPKVIKNREAFFAKFAEFINELDGRYITAIDSGTSPADMDIIAKYTPYVTCTTQYGADSDPSPFTALGVMHAIKAAVKYKLMRETLENVHVSIQGVGHVGYLLAKDLHQLGAKLTISDIDQKNVARCVAEFNAAVCHPDEIYDVEADIFAPCALGAVLNLKTIKRLRVKIVAGSANNQLAHHHYGALLHERGILYAPDFLINAGGLIHVAMLYDHDDIKRSLAQINGIYERCLEIFTISQQENMPTNEVAFKIAYERLYS